MAQRRKNKLAEKAVKAEKAKEPRIYTLRIGEIPEPIDVLVGSRKSALDVRNALRESGIKADVVTISAPRIIG